jgi:putative DNA primase/helicase
VAPLTITQLTKNFGLQPLLNKWLAVMWDASIGSRNSNTAAAVETLKCISGEDSFTIDRKNRDQLSNIKLDLSILMIANKIVDLRDSTGALAGRFTFLETTGSFYGDEDPSIEAKLEAELPGILNDVIRAPEGRILEHPNSESMQKDFEELSSPYIAFVNEWCDLGSDNFIPADILWAYYVDWAGRNNHYEPSPQKLKIEFAGAVDGVQKDYRPKLSYTENTALVEEYNLDPRPGPKMTLSMRPRCYRGIDLKEEVKTIWMSKSGPY